MDTVQKCPYCKSEYSGQVDKCPKCGYPITGTKEEQGVFVGRRIMMKGDIDESATGIKRARVVLIYLPAFMLVSQYDSLCCSEEWIFTKY